MLQFQIVGPLVTIRQTHIKTIPWSLHNWDLGGNSLNGRMLQHGAIAVTFSLQKWDLGGINKNGLTLQNSASNSVLMHVKDVVTAGHHYCFLRAIAVQ